MRSSATSPDAGAPGAAGCGAWPFPAGSSARIAYGAERVPADPAALARLPSVSLAPGHRLRFNSETFQLPQPVPGQPLLSAEQRVVGYLKQCSGGWNRRATRFIEGYMAHLRLVVATNRSAIADRLRPLTGLFAPEDVLFSAPLPLPRALLPLADDTGTVPCLVDWLLWLGEGAQVVLLEPSSLTPGAERRRRERLVAAGIGLHVMSEADMSRPVVFAHLLGPSGDAFWRDDILPVAPGAPRLPEF